MSDARCGQFVHARHVGMGMLPRSLARLCRASTKGMWGRPISHGVCLAGWLTSGLMTEREIQLRFLWLILYGRRLLMFVRSRYSGPIFLCLS